MLGTMLQNVREQSPLIHSITNYVTANDCANMLLALGARPIMADAVEEVASITENSDGSCINIGTLNGQTIPVMFAAGRKANTLNHPVILDPVGIGVSTLRRQTVERLLKDVRFTAIRGNLSEIQTLAEGINSGKGVDSVLSITRNNCDTAVALAKSAAKKTGAVIMISGAMDVVSDGEKTYCIANGHPMMQKVTGTGCMLSAMTAAFIAVNPEHITEAAAATVCVMGLAGEIAYERLTAQDGNMTYRNLLIDAVYNMTPESLERGARYEMR